LGENMDAVTEVFSAVADLAPSARDDYFCRNSVPAHVRNEVESLLAHDGRGLTDSISDAARRAIARLDRPTRCGAYRPIELLGRGGMGSVWLAERVDGEVTQRAALKLLNTDARAPRFRDRFLQERQILARLSHPNVARLLDAGHSDEGQPYLILEFINGEPIDRFLNGRDVRFKLKVFLKVCSAVAYAHRNLVIHRDLKPSNILVTPDGEPKLLDFGIAKLVDMSGDSTVTLERLLTPDYASPEQVTGKNTGTATDVYSLGAILYKLLTGRSPHQLNESDQSHFAAVICERPITPPSSVAAGLKADIDAIVLKALRKQSEERYASVDQLADDIDNFLQHRPVRARAGSMLYRTRRFVRRYWVPMGAATIAVAGLTGGLITADLERRQAVQARMTAETRRVEAQKERDAAEAARAIATQQQTVAQRERAAADTQRKLAEARFQQVRGLAGSLMTVDAEIRQLTGATKARQALVNTALAYLEKLEREAGEDAEFRIELANVYVQVALVQAGPGQPNLSQPVEAIKSLQKGERLLTSILNKQPSHREALRKLLVNFTYQSRIIGFNRQDAEAAAIIERALKMFSRFDASTVKSDLNLMMMGAALGQIAQGLYINLNRLPEARRHGRNAIELRRDVYRVTGTPTDEAELSGAMLNYAIASRWAGDLDIALSSLHEGRTILERQYQPDSPDWQVARRLLYAYHQEASILGDPGGISLGRWAEALRLYDRALGLARQLASGDRVDAGIRPQMAALAGRAGHLRLQTDPANALALFDEAFKICSDIPAASASHLDKLQHLAGSIQALIKLGREQEASTRLDRLFTLLREAKKYPGAISPRNYLETGMRARAAVLAAQGRKRDAITVYEEIAGATEKGEQKPSSDLHWALSISEIYEQLAGHYEDVNEPDAATRCREKRRRLWELWDQKLPNNPFVRRQLEAAGAQ
jgi:tetratricopeptide (TPR) repeat protein